IRIWDPVSRQELFRLKDHSQNNMITGVAFSPDSRLLATCGPDRTVQLWDLKGRKQLEFRGHSDSGRWLLFLARGRPLSSCGATGTLVIGEVATGKVLRQVKLPGQILSLAASPVGKTVAVGGSDPTIRVYDCDTGNEVAALNGHRSTVYHVAFSPDGKMLA